MIDNGSEMLKVGFAGDFQPRYTVPSVVGRFRSGIAPDTASAKREAFIGYDATRRKSLMSFDYPLSGNFILVDGFILVIIRSLLKHRLFFQEAWWLST